MQIGINSFGLNKVLSQNFTAGVLSLKEAGISHLEPLIVFDFGRGLTASALCAGLRRAGKDGGMWPVTLAAERIEFLRRNGIAVYGAQISLVDQVPGGLTVQLEQLAAFAAQQELRYYVYSPKNGRLSDAAGEAEIFRKAIDALRPQGVELYFHAHYNEFQKENGDTVFDYLLREVPDLPIELDVGWAQYAGRDPIRCMEQYRDHIGLLHLKDLPTGADPQNDPAHAFCAIGAGTLPLEAVLREAHRCPLKPYGMIIDQDNSAGDYLEDCRVGVRNICAAAQTLRTLRAECF